MLDSLINLLLDVSVNIRDLFDFILLGSFWGASFIFMRYTTPEFGAIPLVEIRMGIAALFLLSVLFIQGNVKQLAQNKLHMLVVGILNAAVPFVLLAYATLHLPGGFASILNAMVPMFGAIVAFLWLKERLNWSRIIGLIIGFSGVVSLVWDKLSFNGEGTGPAVLAATIATFSYGFSANYTRRFLKNVEPLVIATASLLAAAVVCLPLASFYWPKTNPTSFSWLCATALGFICTGWAFIIYYRLISKVGPAQATAVTFLIPVFGLLWGRIFLSEVITLKMVLGCVVILAGTSLSTGFWSLGKLVSFNRKSNEKPLNVPEGLSEKN